MSKSEQAPVQQVGFVETVNPQTVLLAREQNGITQEELAKGLGISQGELSKIENGQSLRGKEFATALSEALGEPVEFFFEPTHHISLDIGLHRKRVVGARALRMSRARVHRVRMVLQRLIQSLDVPECGVPMVDLEEYRPLDKAPVVSLAEELRARWHLPKGPIANVVELAEYLNVLVIPIDFGTTKIDGRSIAFANDGLPPTIFIRPDVPGDRQRFTVAHELAHIVLHHHLRHRLPGDEAEDEANRLAAELLMPARQVRPFLRDLTLKKAVQLKMRWRVSIQSIVQRAYTLKLITKKQRHSLHVQISQKGWNRHEAVHVPNEMPMLFKELFDVHMNELGYSAQGLCKAVRISENFLWEHGIAKGLRVV